MTDAAADLLPATFPNELRALAWACALDPARYDVLEVVPSKTTPGRWQVRVRPLNRKAGTDA